MNGRTRVVIALRRRRKSALGIGLAVLVAGGVVTGWLLTQRPAPPPRVSYTNVSRNFKACVLTTTADATQTGPLWTTVQAAARDRPINAQHVVTPAGSTDELIPCLNSLVALHCQLIITGRSDVAGSLATVAKTNSHLIFVNVSATSTNLSNIHDLPHVARVISAGLSPRHVDADAAAPIGRHGRAHTCAAVVNRTRETP